MFACPHGYFGDDGECRQCIEAETVAKIVKWLRNAGKAPHHPDRDFEVGASLGIARAIEKGVWK